MKKDINKIHNVPSKDELWLATFNYILNIFQRAKKKCKLIDFKGTLCPLSSLIYAYKLDRITFSLCFQATKSQATKKVQ